MITNAQGKALVKTHGFGVTSIPLMMRYPFHTVDSTSWVKSGGFGVISVPVYVNGKPTFDCLPVRVHISQVLKERATGQIFHNYGPALQAVVKKWLSDEGFTLGEIRHSRARRCGAMLAYFNKLIPHLPKDFKHRGARFGSVLPTLKNQKPIKPEFHLFHSTNLTNDQGSLLTEFNCRHRLLSYFELREAPRERVAGYVQYGVEPGFTRRQPKQKWGDRGYLAFRYLALEQRWKDYRDEADRAGGEP
jgi:hypothetical protein